jgi:ABC-type uncharacterized transport system permease subunit
MPTTTEYKPTLMEKLLGNNYKWWYLLQFRFKNRTISLINNSFFVVGHFLILLGTLTTWWLANNKIIDLDLQQKWTYFIVGELFFNLIFNFGEFEALGILKGHHVIDLLRPQNYLTLKFFHIYGESLLQNLIKGFVLAALLIIMIISGNITYFNLTNFLSFLSLIPIALTLLFLINIIVSFSAFFVSKVDGIILNFAFLQGLLMGRIFPLNLLIPNFWFNLCNPFAYLFYHPMQIYLGKYNANETFLVFLGGLFWCMILYFLAKLVFQIGLKRNESVGL